MYITSIRLEIFFFQNLERFLIILKDTCIPRNILFGIGVNETSDSCGQNTKITEVGECICRNGFTITSEGYACVDIESLTGVLKNGVCGANTLPNIYAVCDCLDGFVKHISGEECVPCENVSGKINFYLFT